LENFTPKSPVKARLLTWQSLRGIATGISKARGYPGSSVLKIITSIR